MKTAIHAIHTKTKEEFKKVLEIFERKGWTWFIGGGKPTKFIDGWDDYEENTCIVYKSDLGYGLKEWYKNAGCKMISFKKFLEMEKYTPTEEEARQEMILNIKEQMK